MARIDHQPTDHPVRIVEQKVAHAAQSTVIRSNDKTLDA
jgi:hypothetical protein